MFDKPVPKIDRFGRIHTNATTVPTALTLSVECSLGYRDVMMVAEEETHPACSGLDMSGDCRDAVVEESLHLVNAHGHALAHKKVFGIKWKPRSKLTKAMDKARFDSLLVFKLRTFWALR